MVENRRETFRDPGVSEFEHVLVRPLDGKDLDAVVKIDARHSGRTRREFFQKKLEEALRDTGVRISLAAEVAGAFAGFALGRIYYGEFGVPEPVAIVDSIGVDPAFAGQHVGSALMHQMEMNLSALGVERMVTEVAWNSFALLGFLEQRGFHPAPVLTLEKVLRH